MSAVAATFLAFLGVFTAIGVASFWQATKTSDDYLLASRSVPPWLMALSSVATNNSGYMFIGLIGFTYAEGLAAAWLQSGWIVGDVILWAWFHRRLRETTGELGSRTVPSLLAGETGGRSVVVVTAVLSFVLLATYAGAQFQAGGKALSVLFGWGPATGALIGAGIVLLYSFSGGIRASIWTDAAQAIVMIAAMSFLVIAGIRETGGFAGLFADLRAIDPELLELFPDDSRFGFALWYVGFIFGGLGVAGQPHIVIRTMSLRSPDDIPAARKVYFLWYVPFSILAILAGLCARVLLPDAGSFDPELALPRLAMMLLPTLFIGLTLAGLFAATMSTADSLVLSCSAALTQDLVPRASESYGWAKVGTTTATLLALVLALRGPESVFVLVLIAWSALATAFGPLLLLRLLGQPVREGLALAMIVAGLGTSLFWRFGLGWTDDLYEILPGVAAGLAVWAIGHAFTSPAPGARRGSA